jgi:hypothetical protein
MSSWGADVSGPLLLGGEISHIYLLLLANENTTFEKVEHTQPMYPSTALRQYPQHIFQQ